MSRIVKFLSFIMCALCLWCCKPESGADTHSDWMLTQMQRDSIFFSDTHLYVFIVLIVLMAVFIGYSKYKHMLLWFVHFRDASSLYPCAFTITMATASMIYSTLQKFFPEVWVTYYFNPSLNPFTQPVLVSLFLVSLWLSVLFLLSVVFDLVDKIPFFQMVSYTLSLVCLGCIIYLVLTFSVPYYIGYGFYSLYVFFSVSRFIKSKRT